MTIRDIAMVAHEANRAYSRSLGDFSHPPWEKTPPWQRESVTDGVRFLIENPEAGPRESHANWLKYKLAAGWTRGPIKDEIKKTHPLLVEFDSLQITQQRKDAIFCAIVRALEGAIPKGNPQ
jgi:hypothetical protein